jgi:putative ABC transport system permease protein
VDTLKQDLRYSLRTLMKHRGFTAIAVLTMAVGIGANTTLFSAMDAVVFRPFSFPNQERLMAIWEYNPEVGIIRGSVSPANFNEWREHSRSFDQIAAISTDYFDLSQGDQPERFMGYKVSPGFFEVLGAKALYGRTLEPGDDQPGNERVIVLKHSLWRSRFSSDPQLVGQTITINGKTFTVIGVMPPDFNFPFNAGEMWAPLVFTPQQWAMRGNHFLQVIGRLKPGVGQEQASEDLNLMAKRDAELYPETNGGRSVRILSLTEDAARGARMYAPVLLASVAFVLLIACANVANLLLVRVASRQKEIAIRQALGASRRALIRQLLTDSILLTLLGGGLGLFLSVWGLKGLARGIPESFAKFIPGWPHMEINLTAFVFTLVVSIATGLLCGFIPAVQASRVNFNDVLKEGGRSGSDQSSRRRARSFLVVSEIALSVILLIGAGLIIRSFVEMLRSDLGLEPSNVLTMQISLPQDGYATDEARAAFYREFVNRVAAQPGVAAAGAVGTLPMEGSSNSRGFSKIGETVFPQNKRPVITWRVITPAYLEAIGTRLREGRDITQEDRAGAARVALVNEAFARRFLPGREPIGKLFTADGGDPFQIVGVVDNVMDEDFDQMREPEVYVPHAQDPWRTMYLVVKGSSAPAALTASVRSELNRLDPTIPLFNSKLMTQLIDDRISPKRLATAMLGCFALIALLLAAVGLYALTSHTVEQRTHEIGVRMALGAQASDVVRLVVGQGIGLAAIGIGLGLAGAFGVTRLMSNLLFGVSATDPLTFFGIALVLAVVVALACWIPARRATRVDPMIALRCE